MKKRILSLLAAIVCALAALVLVATNRPTPTVHAAGGACPASFIVGFYGFSATDFISRGGTVFPAATGGLLAFSPDPAPAQLTGTITGKITTNTGSAVTRVTVRGTYTMTGTDCSGKAVLFASNGAVLHYDLVPMEWINGPAADVLMVRTDLHHAESVDLMGTRG